MSAIEFREVGDLPEPLDEDYPFILPGGSEEYGDDPIKCLCGGSQFEITVPRFVCTVAKCLKCGAKAIIHEG